MRNCPDCGVPPGQVHIGGCDVERCSSCKDQYIGCACDDHDPDKSRWSGEWPGVAECRERGWYSVMRPDLGTCVPSMGNWWPCTKDYPGAGEDLNRWSYFAQTGKDPFAEVEVLFAPPGTHRRA